MTWFKNAYRWYDKNQQHLSLPFFVGGFISDLLSVRELPLSSVVPLYAFIFFLAILATLGDHYFSLQDEVRGGLARTGQVICALGVQFLCGGLLSGLFIFYTRSAALSASWPFVLLLVIVLLGNEIFHHHRERLAFKSILFFFTLYAYTIFALPTVLNTLGIQTFIESTAISVGGFVVFLLILSAMEWRHLHESIWEIIAGAAIVVVVVNVSYFTGIIPPLPLALKDSGVYQSISHTNLGYEVSGEINTHAWWDIAHIEPSTVHYVPGTSLSVYSAVFAPIALTTAIVHKWEWYDPAKKAWTFSAEIAFPIEGGRDGGYRGYSTLNNLKEGEYRVSIETLSGQVIGRVYFDAIPVSTPASAITQIK